MKDDTLGKGFLPTLGLRKAALYRQETQKQHRRGYTLITAQSERGTLDIENVSLDTGRRITLVEQQHLGEC